MTDAAHLAEYQAARRGTVPVVFTAAAVSSACGRGVAPLLAAALDGTPAFQAVRRFDVADRRVGVAATLPGSPSLGDELDQVIGEACDQAGLSPSRRSHCPLYLAVHGDPRLPRAADAEASGLGADAFARAVAQRSGLSVETARAYTSACVAASTAVADAAAAVARGRVSSVVVAAGYLVDPDQFALFDAG